MKKLLFILIISILYAACTGTTTGANETTAKTNLPMPYTAAYSSRFSIGNDSTTLTVLNNYHAWETGDMNAFKNTLGDSVMIMLPAGETLHGSRDSVTDIAFAFRDSLASVKLRMDAFIPMHCDDRNEDWVMVWYTETDTYKNGKVDSAYFQDDNMLDRNGHIVYTDSHKRVLK